MKNFALLAMLAVAAASQAQVTAAPLGTWGFNGDGWWAPGENGITYLTSSDSNQRSIAFNPATGNVLLSNGLGVSILNGSTGVRTGFFNMTGVSGGTRGFNTVMATADGQIFGTNLTTTSDSGNPFKVYRWANEAAGVAGTLSHTFSIANATTARLGDASDITGSGNSVTFVSGKGGGAADLNGYYSFAFNGSTLTPTSISVGGTANGQFRLGLAYDGAGNVVGKQTGAGNPYQIAAGSSLAGSWATVSAGESAVDFVTLNGYTLMATIDANSNAVRIYDVTGLSGNQALTPILTLNNTTGAPNGNGNATSDLAFGAITGNSVNLYALNTNNGIQAFTITAVPEPASMIALGAGLLALARRRRSK
ncbi:MAG: hypothetical protein Fur0036_17540 [Fimbriimonadaceae bacterium]